MVMFDKAAAFLGAMVVANTAVRGAHTRGGAATRREQDHLKEERQQGLAVLNVANLPLSFKTYSVRSC